MTIPTLFAYDFMLRAIAAGLLSAITLPAIGTFIVVRRYSQLPDTLAHASLLGLAIAALTDLTPLPLAIATTVSVALVVEWARSATQTYGDAILALATSGSLGAAAVFLSLSHGFNTNLLGYLFGSITTVSDQDIVIVGTLALVVLGVLAWGYRTFFAITIDEELAAAAGIRVGRWNAVLVVLAALAIGLSIRVIGVLLIGALIVIPAVTALQLRLSFRYTLLTAIACGIVAVSIGLVAAYYLDLAPGGAIVTTAVGLFALALVGRYVRRGR